MANRTEYNACISKGLKGKTGLSKEERQLLFCTESRLCSGKASSREEAKASCSLPKEPKPTNQKTSKRTKTDSCEKEASKLTQCMMRYFDDNNLYKQVLNVNSVEIAIENALLECSCQK